MGWLPYWEIPKIMDKKLSERERLVIGMRLQGYTLQQVADTLDRSKETVRQSEAKAWAHFKIAYDKAVKSAHTKLPQSGKENK